MILVLARGLDLLVHDHGIVILGATGHRITSQRLDELKSDFARLNVETSRKVLRIYRSRKENRECAPSCTDYLNCILANSCAKKLLTNRSAPSVSE